MTTAPIARVALFGNPLGHSVSPAMHHAAAAATGTALRYELWPLPADELAGAVETVRGDAWLGANVTLPHKPAMLALVDDVSARARRIGAINTLYKRNGRLLGENTDAPAFMRCLRLQLGFEPANERVVILGAGGAARAAVVALGEAGVRSMALWNRSADRAAALAAALEGAGATLRVVPSGALDRWLPEATLLVNATSVGLDGSSLPIEHPLVGAQGLRVFDMVYGLEGTPLVRHALGQGLVAVDGLWMLVRQAAAAFALWTGVEPPEAVMHAAALRALAARSDAQRQGSGQ